MKYSIALSLAVSVPFAALQASPPTKACPKESGFAIKEQGVRAALPSVAPIVFPPAYKVLTAPAKSSDEALVLPRCDESAKMSGASGGMRIASGDCDDASPSVSKKGSNSSPSGQTLRHAINTKGTGTGGRAGPRTSNDQDCDG